MAKLKNLFTSGKMNKDLDERLVPKGEYRDALNVKVSNSNGSDVGSIENSLSSTQMSSLSLGANARCIGVIEDDGADKIYWAVSSDSGSYICEFSKDSSYASIVLSDTRVDNVLGFNLATFVDMAIINDAENGKRFLFITDNVSEPKYIEIESAKLLSDSNFLLEDVSLIKNSPLTAPSIQLEKTDDSEENNIEDKFLSFAYRYIYEHGEISALSPFSDFAFMAKDFRYDYNSGTNKSMLNEYNKINLTFNTGSKNVKEIEIIVKESGVTTAYIVETMDKAIKGWTDDSNQTFSFTNNKIYKAISNDQLLRLYDNVPLKAKAIEIIGNRVVFGNYTESYNISNNGNKIKPSITTTYSSSSGLSGTPHKTVKSNMDYEVALAYLDGKGRMTTPLTSEGNDVHVPINKCNKNNSLSVEIASQAPDWATGYRFFIKQSRNDYDVISPVVFYTQGVYAYIKVEGEDINKVKEGDFLFLKSDTSGIKSAPTKVKVLESEYKSRNFLEDDSEENTLQEAGNYIKVDTEEISLDETSVDTFLYDGYAFRTDVTKNDFGSPVAYIEDTVFYGDGLNDVSVSGSYSSTTDTRYEIEILSEGTTDRFRWRELDCKENSYSPWNDNNDAGILIGGTTSLSNGLSISFSASTGHTKSDRWVINAKSASRPIEWNEGGDVNSFGRKAIMNFKCKSIGSESIKAGAIITIEYNDSRSEPNVDNISGNVYQRFVSSANYDNIEEWFWEDNVLSNMSHPKDPSEIIFRRGNLDTAPDKVLGERLLISPSGDLFMSILSESNYTGSGKVRVDVTFKILELDNPIIFETDYKNASSDVFYELPKTYGVSNGNHLGDVNQVFGTTNALVNLDYFNAFGWYNGYESIKISDAFNESKMLLDSKPLVPIDNYKQVVRFSSLTYSGPYDSTTSFNALNEFNLSLLNYKDLDANYGNINKIISRSGDLTVLQNNRVSKVLFEKSVLYNADGSGNISQSKSVLGQDVPYQGEYGITGNIYSATRWSGEVYFADEKRSAVLRLGSNGLFKISDYGMRSWFNENLKPNSKVVSSFDPFNGQYVLNISQQSIEWLEDTYNCAQDVDIQWLEDTYVCSQESVPTTTSTTLLPTTTIAPTTHLPTTSTTQSPTTTTTQLPTTSTTTQLPTTSTTDVPTTTTTQLPTTTTTQLPTTSTTTETPTTTTTQLPTTSTTITTQLPTTTTTTQNAVYYALRRCSDLSSGWRTQQEITEISLSVNDRVEGSGPTTYIVTGTTTSGTNIGIVSDTGLTGCPEPVTTTTTISYNYYYAQPCGGGTTVTMRSVTAFSNGESFKFAGDDTCYEVVASGAPANNNDWSEAFPDCSACLPQPTTDAPTTDAPTTDAPCNCVTVDVLNTQLTSGGLDLYYIYNSCEIGEKSVNLNNYFGIEQNGSTYFGFCQQGSSSNMYKYGPNGDPFVGLPGMNTNPNGTICTVDGNCSPVVPATTTQPATTTTQFIPGCFTYSIQNNSLSENLTFQYRDCDGNLISDQVVLADSGTPDFCAEEGSVSRQSGTNSWVLTIEATTCTVVEPTVAPTAAPTTQAFKSWIAERFDGLVYAYVWLQQGYQINDLVTLNDGSGQCWTLGDQTTANGQYNITGTCPPPPTAAPTVTPTAAPTDAPTTARPTVAPTAAPTASPTVSPTAAPTAFPTQAPQPTAAPTASPTAAPTGAPTLGPEPTAAPTAAPTVSPTVAPTTTTTTVAPVVYEVAVTSGQSTSDDSCNLFAFTPLWSLSPTPENGARYYTDSGLTNEFNGGDQWYGFDLDFNGVTVSARITSFGYLYSTTQCAGGGGFP